MEPNGKIDTNQVQLFKNVLHRFLEGMEKAGIKLELLEVAIASEEFAQELRRQSAQNFKDKTIQ